MPPTDVEETATLPLEGFDSVGQDRAIQQKVENNSNKSINSVDQTYIDKWEHFHSMFLLTDRYVLKNPPDCIQSYKSRWLCLQLMLKKLLLFHWKGLIVLDKVVLYSKRLKIIVTSLKQNSIGQTYIDKWEHFHSMFLLTDRYVLKNPPDCIQSYKSRWLCLQLMMKKLLLFHWKGSIVSDKIVLYSKS